MLIALLAACLSGCGGGEPAAGAAAAFDSLAAEALDLYVRLHPLRASRLGIERADSLLFTLSGDEISAALADVESLLSSFSDIPTAGLDRRRLEDSILIVDWLRGERYALGPRGTVYDNPVLLAWMIEEALFGIPSRRGEPRPGEAGAWESRLGRIALLAGEGPELISKPGPPHLARSLEIMDGVLARMPSLERRAMSRYGRPPVNLESAAGSVARLRGSIALMLEGQAGGRVIMGREELTMAMKYSEHIDLDTGELAGDAEKILARLARQARPDPGIEDGVGDLHPDSLLREAWEKVRPRSGPGRRERGAPEVLIYEPIYAPMELPVNPYLTTPVVPAHRVRAVFDRRGGDRCRPTVIVPAGSGGREIDIVYGILMSASVAGGPLPGLCAGERATRWVFAPATWELGWRNLARTDLPGVVPLRRIAVAAEINRRERLALARMIATFRLHSGVYTTESAARFLAGVAGLDAASAGEAAAAASVSPAAAFEGLAMMMTDGMLRRATMEGGARSPRRKVMELMEDRAGLPLSVISGLIGPKQ